MKIDIALTLGIAFLFGFMGCVIVLILIERAQPQFAVVDIKALIEQQTARLIASKVSEAELTTRGQEAVRHVLHTLNVWGRDHNRILLAKSQCLSHFPEVTTEIQQVLEDKDHAK